MGWSRVKWRREDRSILQDTGQEVLFKLLMLNNTCLNRKECKSLLRLLSRLDCKFLRDRLSRSHSQISADSNSQASKDGQWSQQCQLHTHNQRDKACTCFDKNHSNSNLQHKLKVPRLLAYKTDLSYSELKVFEYLIQWDSNIQVSSLLRLYLVHLCCSTFQPCMLSIKKNFKAWLLLHRCQMGKG